jgi:vacuolar protein sorting-associated protein 35
VSDPYGSSTSNGGAGPSMAATAHSTAPPENQQQASYLRDALAQARRAGALVRRAADQGNLREALRYSAAMLGELRTGFLGPQQYYELYVAVGDELEALAQFLQEETEAAAAAGGGGAGAGAAPANAAQRAAPPRSAAELYEAVQHAGNVLPRLYLMVVAGSILARSPGCPPGIRARDVLFDLAEMAKGVQHPLRGLFLRAFLCQRARPVLCPPVPAAGGAFGASFSSSTPPPPPPSVEDAVDFLLANFVESNKLWVRMQQQQQQQQQQQRGGGGGGGGGNGAGFPAPASSSTTADRREQERAQLRDLVGKNVTQLAQLDGLGFPLYRRAVLPRLLEQVVSCRDALAQGYLMQVIVQGFPDRWHAGTLDELLAALPELQPGVRLAAVVASLADRLARFAAAAEGEGEEAGGGGGVGGVDGGAPADLRTSGALERLSAAVARASAAHGGGLSAASVVEMHAALASFARAVGAAGGAGSGGAGGDNDEDVLAHVDKVLRDCREALLARAAAAAAAAAATAAAAGPAAGGQPSEQQPDLSSAAAASIAADAAAERALTALLSEPFGGGGAADAPRPPSGSAAALRGPMPLPQVLRGLPSLPPLAALLPARARRALAARVANAALAQLAIGGAGDGGGAAPASAAAAASADALLRTPEMADRLLAFAAPLLGASGPGGPADGDDDTEEDVLLAARLIHALLLVNSCSASSASTSSSAAASSFAALKAVRPHVERAPSRRARLVLLPTLAFGALRLVRALLLLLPPPRTTPQGPDATASTATVATATAREALQWVLELALALAADSQPPLDASAAVAAALGAPPPPSAASALLSSSPGAAAEAAAAEGAAVASLRVMLAGALAASEELRSEALAYEFLEQALTLYEESGIGGSARHRAPALQAIVGVLHRCRALGADNREALAQSAGGYAGKLLHRADQCRAVLASAHLAWQEEEDEEEGEGGEERKGAGAEAAVAAEAGAAAAAAAGAQQQQQRYPPCRDSAKVMAALKRALKVAQAAKQQRVLVGTGGGAAGGGDRGGGGAVSAAQAAHAAHAALASATYLGLAVAIANKYLYFYARGVDGLTSGAVQQLLELVAAEAAASSRERGVAAAAAAGGTAAGEANSAAALLAAAAAAGGPTAAVAAAATRADAEARRFWAATLAHVAYQQRLEQQQGEQGAGGGGGGERGRRPFSALQLPSAAAAPPPPAAASPLSPAA